MEPSFSLEYYDRIFGRRGREFCELVEALAVQLESYVDDLGPLLAARDRPSLSRLRHSHRPMVLNLRLERLRAVEAEIVGALDVEAPTEQMDVLARRFADEARTILRGLAEIHQKQ